ncbi:MAG: 30S ribosomal protein S20 [Gammaproteobacteria bacterium]|nr:30S ribosomal protein S20 [Gammaproteobacteria bacterium]
MANTNQARKRARQADSRRERNMQQRSELRTRIRKVLRAILRSDKDAATAAYKEAVPVVDRMIGHKIIHRNAAARYKSRLNTRIRALS